MNILLIAIAVWLLLSAAFGALWIGVARGQRRNTRKPGD